MDTMAMMRLYVRVVERCSFSRAAEDLDIPRATVTHTIQQIEARLGTRLLERTTRHVRPTPDGETYYHRCLVLLADLEEAEDLFRTVKPKGLLRLNLQSTLAHHIIIPSLPDFMARYPDITLDIGETDRLVDLVEEGVDCALRGGEPQNSALIAVRVALLTQVTVASQSYLDQCGTPDNLHDLARGHRMIAYQSPGMGQVWPLEFQTPQGLETRIIPATLTVKSVGAYVAAARAGLGIIQVPRYHLNADIETGRLLPILPESPPPGLPVSILYPAKRHLPSRVRVFIDWVTAIMRTA